MTIEIKINGCNPDDLVRQVEGVYRTFVGDILGAELMKVSLDELIEITTEKCREAGLALNISTLDPIEAEKTVVIEDKKARRASADVEEEATDNETLKAETLLRLQHLCYEDGKAAIVNRLRKTVGKRFSEVDADRFPEIVKQLDELLAAAKQ